MKKNLISIDSKKNDIRKKIEDLVIKYSNIEFTSKKFLPGKSVIPPSGKVINHEEIMNLIHASLDGVLTTGRFNKEFEKKLSKYLGVKFLITVNI